MGLELPTYGATFVKFWLYVDQGIFWTNKNGQEALFWQDCWVPRVGVLSDHALADIPEQDWNKSVADFADLGEWN